MFMLLQTIICNTQVSYDTMPATVPALVFIVVSMSKLVCTYVDGSSS